MKRDKIHVNDRQLACARITSPEGENYLKAMASAANYAWVNRSSMTFLTRQVGSQGHVTLMVAHMTVRCVGLIYGFESYSTDTGSPKYPTMNTKKLVKY